MSPPLPLLAVPTALSPVAGSRASSRNTSRAGSRRGSTRDPKDKEARAFEAALAVFQSLPCGIDEDAPPEHVIIQDFFDDNGVAFQESPNNWALLSALGRPLSRSDKTDQKHGSLSTRQQLMNSQASLENARKRAQNQRQASLQMQKAINSHAVDIQSLRHFHLFFLPLGYVPSAPIFKHQLNVPYIEDALTKEQTAASELEDEALTTKGSGTSMTNEQRALLFAVFRKSIKKVTAKGGKTALMNRWTWFRFLVHCDLVGPDSSWDQISADKMKIPWVLAGKIFKLFQEANSSPPALSFGSWANALQAVLRSRALYSKGPEIVEAIFKTFLPRAQEQLGITDEDARRQMAGSMAGERKKSMGAAAFGSHASGRSMSRAMSRNMSRSASRALSFFSGAGSTMGDDQSEAGEPEDGKLPQSWQMNLAEQQICEPECMQLLHEYRALLEALFLHYTGEQAFSRQESEPMLSSVRFQKLLKDLHFLPDFVQIFALERHMEACETRYGQESLNFNAFVECLCRICFCHLNIYGNNLQQLAPSKQKMLWVLAMLEARLPTELGGRSEDGLEPGDSPRGLDSLWYRRDETFNISTCPAEEVLFFKTMGLVNLATKLGFERLMSCDVDDDPTIGTFRR